MKILELVLENFEGVYVAMHTDFIRIDLRETKNKICLITGPNGKGKTVLLSQLNPFSSLGTLDERDSLPLIRKDKNGHKRIVILDNGNEYEIDHFYTPNKTSHAVKSYIKKNGEELNPNGNVTSFKEVIKIELDIEPDYMKLVRLGNNVINLMDLKSAERKAFMSKILEDVNVYLVYYKKINSEMNILKNLISLTMDKIKKTNIEDYEEAKYILEIKKEELEELEENILAISDSISKINYQLAQIPNDAKEKMQDAAKKLSKLVKKSGDSMESLSSLESTKKSLEENIFKNKERQKSFQDSLSVYLDELDKSRSDIDITESKIKHVVNETDLDGLIGIIDSLKIRITNEESRYKDCGEIKYTKHDVEEILSFFKEKQEVLNTTYEYGDEPIKKVISIMRKGESVTSYINEHIKKAIEDDEIKSGKALIKRLLSVYNDKPSCGQKCALFKLREALESISGMNDTTEKRDKEFYTYMSLAHSNIKSVILSFSDKKELFELMPESIREFCKMENLYNRIKKTEWIYDREVFFDELSFITEYENYLEDIKTLELKEKELKTLLSSSPLPILESHLKDLKKSIDEYKSKLEYTKNEIKIISGVIKKDEATLEDMEILIEIVKRKEEIETVYNTNKDHLLNQQTLIDDLAVHENMLAAKKYDKQKLQNTISSLANGLIQLKEYTKELKVYQKFYDDWIILKESLSSNKGIPLVFIDLYLKKAKAVVNSLLDEIYDGNMYIEDFDIDASKFDIPFHKNGMKIADIRYASQGERSFFSISLSFAISYQSMSRYNIMLLDELDSVLDETNRANFIPLLEKLEDMIEAEQMFVISHNNMFSMYPVDVISVVNDKPESSLSNHVEILYS